MRTGKKVGVPPKYKTVDEMQAKIDEYFKFCEGEKYTDPDTGKPYVTEKGYFVWLRDPKPPTVTGLALALGFTSRQALLNYQAKPTFVDTVTRAKSLVEQYTEERLFDKNGVNGAKFSLANNFEGWREKQSVDFEGNVKSSGETIVKFEGELEDWSE